MQKFATPTLFLRLSNIYFIYFFFESRITGTRHQERFRNHRILTILSRRIIVKFDRAPIDSVKWASRGNEIQTWSRFAAPAPLVCLQSLSWQMHLRFWPPDYQGGMRLKALLRRLNLSIHRPVPYIYIYPILFDSSKESSSITRCFFGKNLEIVDFIIFQLCRNSRTRHFS